MSLWLDNQGRVRPGWRFLLGAVVAVIANFIAIGVAGPLSHSQTRLLEALYRPLTMVLLLGGYALLLMSADQVHERLFSAMGLGKFPGWVRQALWGMAIGTALTVVALAGFAVGLRVQDRLDQRTFNRAVLIFLAVLGAWLLVSTLR